jgi:hypothetical protein
LVFKKIKKSLGKNLRALKTHHPKFNEICGNNSGKREGQSRDYQIRSLGRTIEIIEVRYRKTALLVEIGVIPQLVKGRRYRKNEGPDLITRARATRAGQPSPDSSITDASNSTTIRSSAVSGLQQLVHATE